MPAYWTSAKGTKRISLFSGYVGGEALSINDHLEIVGYQYRVSSLPGYYYDQNSNSICDEATEGPCYKDTKLAKGFKYSKKIGLKPAFNQEDTRLSVAFRINNSGTTLGYISKPDFTNSNGEFALAAQKVNKDLSFSGRPQTSKPAVWYAIYMADFTAGSSMTTILEHQEIFCIIMLREKPALRHLGRDSKVIVVTTQPMLESQIKEQLVLTKMDFPSYGQPPAMP
jgi:hypothetical protein